MFDVSRRATFDKIQYWLNELKNNLTREVPVLIVANKIDLRDSVEDHVTTEEATEKLMGLRNIKKLNYLESSALLGVNIPQIFEQLVADIKHKK